MTRVARPDVRKSSFYSWLFRIVRNSEQPGIKGGLLTKRVQFLVGEDERLLRDVSGLMDRADYMHQRTVKPSFVTRYQFPKRITLARQTLVNQLLIGCAHVVHSY